MANKLPEVIDLFSGCGGLALGFAAEGFDIAHGADIEPAAVSTASLNLHWRHGEESGHTCMDLTAAAGRDVCAETGPEGCVVIGGPPCQAYSNIGVAKLRSLGEHRKNTNDKRGRLYEDFIRIALDLDARAIVMENVPDSVRYGGENIPQTVCDILNESGYRAYWTLLNAANYGVPQTRERIFVLAVRDNENANLELPKATHASTDPQLTQNDVRFRAFIGASDFRPAPEAEEGAHRWVTVGEALGDLPSLLPHASSKYVLRGINTVMPYSTEPVSDYQKLMRTWFGDLSTGVTANCIRRTDRDFPIFAQMRQGDDFTQASEIADRFLREACRVRGITPAEDDLEYDALRRSIVPPYDRENFKSKWRRLSLDVPSHTLPAHLAVDTYSHIHPTEPRGISVREAARLQSFPDGFMFQCSMGDAFRQIGNAVPPILARAVASAVRKAFQ